MTERDMYIFVFPISLLGAYLIVRFLAWCKDYEERKEKEAVRDMWQQNNPNEPSSMNPYN